MNGSSNKTAELRAHIDRLTQENERLRTELEAQRCSAEASKTLTIGNYVV